jgi:rhamnosyltransferase subunit A
METKILEMAGFNVYTEMYWRGEHAKTVLLINGALSTTGAFGQTVKYLEPYFNLILFDLPFAGKSREHNVQGRVVTKEDEVRIILALIERFQVNSLLSVSWGGVSAMLALSESPASVERAIISSFSPLINEAMRDYLDNGQAYLAARDKRKIGSLLNDTVGKYLPRLFKLYNFKHLISLAEHEYKQIEFHIEQVRELSAKNYVERFAQIKIPVLFVNGERDEYTTAEDARQFARYVTNSQFVVVPGAGHFLDLESKSAWLASRETALSFLGAATAVPQYKGLSPSLV